MKTRLTVIIFTASILAASAGRCLGKALTWSDGVF